MPQALEAVLAEVAREGFDASLFGGDLIAGPFPARRVARARALGRVVRARQRRARAGRVGSRARSRDGDARAGSPRGRSRRRVDGVLYCHATPQDDTIDHRRCHARRVLARDLRRRRRARRRRSATRTCSSSARRRAAVVNAGSVGMPYEGEVAAFWLLVDDGEPSFRRTPFDVERARSRDTAASDWPRAASFVDENLRGAVTRDEAVARLRRMSERCAVGRVGKPHGLDGSFVVEQRERGPRAGSRSARSCSPAAPTLEVVASKRAGGRPVIRLEPARRRGALRSRSSATRCRRPRRASSTSSSWSGSRSWRRRGARSERSSM